VLEAVDPTWIAPSLHNQIPAAVAGDAAAVIDGAAAGDAVVAAVGAHRKPEGLEQDSKVDAAAEDLVPDLYGFVVLEELLGRVAPCQGASADLDE
jgi:hypothetical protein